MGAGTRRRGDGGQPHGAVGELSLHGAQSRGDPAIAGGLGAGGGRSGGAVRAAAGGVVEHEFARALCGPTGPPDGRVDGDHRRRLFSGRLPGVGAGAVRGDNAEDAARGAAAFDGVRTRAQRGVRGVCADCTARPRRHPGRWGTVCELVARGGLLPGGGVARNAGRDLRPGESLRAESAAEPRFHAGLPGRVRGAYRVPGDALDAGDRGLYPPDGDRVVAAEPARGAGAAADWRVPI